MTTEQKDDMVDEELPDSNLRIAITGSVNSSKSTSVGVLITGNLDDGNGSARSTVLKLPHEKTTGRSSSVSYNYIKQQMPDGSRRIVTMVDLCGHKQYLRTTLYGITAHRIDYGMVVIGSNMGMNVMDNGSFANSNTAEHMNILHQLGIPFFIIMSKRDLCTGVPGSESSKCECLVPNCVCKAELLRNPEYQKTRRDIVTLLRDMSYQPVWVDSLTTDALLGSWTNKLLKMMNGTKFVPIIVTSNKTGFNINLLKNLISTLHRFTIHQLQMHLHSLLRQDIGRKVLV
jgi:GTPase